MSRIDTGIARPLYDPLADASEVFASVPPEGQRETRTPARGSNTKVTPTAESGQDSGSSSQDRSRRNAKGHVERDGLDITAF